MTKRVVVLEKMLNRAIRFRLKGKQPNFAEMLNGGNQYEGILKGVSGSSVVLDGVCQKCKPNHGDFVYLGDDCSFPRERIFNLSDASLNYELSDERAPSVGSDREKSSANHSTEDVGA